MARITNALYKQVQVDLELERARTSLLKGYVTALEEGSRVLGDRVVELEEAIATLIKDGLEGILSHQEQLAQRDEDLQELSDLAAEKIVTAESKHGYLAQVLVAIASYGGSDAKVPANIASAAVQDFLPESA